MKRFLLLALICFALVLGVTGCEKAKEYLPQIDLERVSVTFVVDGNEYRTKEISRGSRVSEIGAPQKDNLIFVGWFLDEGLTQKFDFSAPVLFGTRLYAGYTLDAFAVGDMVAQSSIGGVVTVHSKSYNTGLGGLIETNSFLSQGSGAVIDISNGFAYVITNYHVVAKKDGYTDQEITVEDAWGNIFEAQIYRRSSSSQHAASEKYDLALICFQYAPINGKSLCELKMVDDPRVNDFIITVGSPEGQKNTFTCGKVISYSKLPEDSATEFSDIPFDVIIHDANITHGSSGSPLLNNRGDLVGINFAGYNNGAYGCAVPISRLKEFLDLYVYK